MNHQIKSIITIIILIGFMAGIAVFINNLESNITGAVIKPQCKCIEDSDCNDNNQCTEDICLYKESCKASVCINNRILGCNS